jgi:hypothetical protein
MFDPVGEIGKAGATGKMTKTPAMAGRENDGRSLVAVPAEPTPKSANWPTVIMHRS